MHYSVVCKSGYFVIKIANQMHARSRQNHFAVLRALGTRVLIL